MSLDAGSFTFTRDIACAPDRLWHLLTDAKAREVWGTPSDDHVLVVDVADTREGGRERHRCGPKDAPEFEVETLWFRLQNPVASFTEALIIGGETITLSLVGYRIDATPKGSHLTVELTTHSFFGADGLPEYEAGWSHALDRLTSFVEKGKL